MSLSPLHKHLIRRTFVQLVTHQDEAIQLFERGLRERSPTLVPLVLGEPGGSRSRPFEMLALFISLINDPIALRILMRQIQTRQPARYVTNGDFQQAGQVLLWVIEQQLGEAFTYDIQMAWTQLYRFLVHVAVESSRDE